MADDPHVYPFPWRLMAVVALIVVAATSVAGIVLSRNGVEEQAPTVASVFTPAPSLLPVQERRQLTVLVQVHDKDGVAVSNALLGVGGDTDFVAELLLPRDLLLPTVPPVQLKDTEGPGGSARAQEPVQALLGVQVDATLALDRLAWIGLLDSLGDAVDLETAASPTSFPLVLDRVLAALPVSEKDVGQLLTSLGSLAQLTVTNEDASRLLAVLGTALRTRQTHREVLPVTTLSTGTSQVSLARQPETDTVVRELFPEALLKPGHTGPPRVVLDRGGASVGQVDAARDALVRAGFTVVLRTGLVRPVATTSLAVPDSSPEVLAIGRDAAAALGLPVASVDVDSRDDAVVDVAVVLGRDFRPPPA